MEQVEKQNSNMDAEYDVVVSELVNRIHEYVVKGIGVRFIDREVEAKTILYPYPYLSRGIRIGRVTVIMGPRGCGKTELAKALTYSAMKSKRYTIIYVTHREVKGAAKTILEVAGLGVKEVVKNLIVRMLPDIASKIITTSTGFEIPAIMTGIDIASMLRQLLAHKEVVIGFIDEFRGSAMEYRQELEILPNILRDLIDVDRKVKLIYLTSDTSASELCNLTGSKIDWWLTWNLPKQYFKKLYRELTPPKHIPFNLIWDISGGNPRELIEIASTWDIGHYVLRKIEHVRRVIEEYIREEGKPLNEVYSEVKIHVGNLDEAGFLKLWTYLRRENIVIDVDNRFEKLTPIHETYWIGKEKAYQIPVYYWILKTISEQKTINITPKQVLNTIKTAIKGNTQPLKETKT